MLELGLACLTRLPAKQRLGPDDGRRSPPGKPELGKVDPEQPVAPGQANSPATGPLLEHRHLLPQRTVLGIQEHSGTEQITDGADNATQHRR